LLLHVYLMSVIPFVIVELPIFGSRNIFVLFLLSTSSAAYLLLLHNLLVLLLAEFVLLIDVLQLKSETLDLKVLSTELSLYIIDVATKHLLCTLYSHSTCRRLACSSSFGVATLLGNLLLQCVLLNFQVINLLDERNVLLEDTLVFFLMVLLVVVQFLAKSAHIILQVFAHHVVFLVQVHGADVLLRFL